MEQGPHRICRSGRHCLALTGVTSDGRCRACRNESHRRNQRDYEATRKGREARERYSGSEKDQAARAKFKGSAKGMLLTVKYNAQRRGA